MLPSIANATVVPLETPPVLLPGAWKTTLSTARQALSSKLAQVRDLEYDLRQKQLTIQTLAGPSYHSTHPSHIILGVCAMEKKATCKPMREILARLPPSEFTVLIFDQKLILEEPVSVWPICDVLIAFYSDGFPLAKVEQYIALRKPRLINDVTSQRLLWDRTNVYKTCVAHGIPVPKHVVVLRGRPDEPDDVVIEADDYIQVNGVRLDKPFVEKPVDADNHEVRIYYPRSSGGGCKELFRKVANRSSAFYPDRDHIRRDDSYIYEDFYPTDGSDVKVYAVTGEYAHAEARKSPAMDGKVTRDESGAEVRYPVILKPSEKDIARRVVEAFGQRVCGFDMLRSKGRSLVCDVNGWSFVKRNEQYTKDCAALLAKAARELMGRPPRHSEELLEEHEYVASARPLGGPPKEELLAVVAIFRHGDRTPKQKLKLLCGEPSFLALYARHSRQGELKEVTLKTAAQLSDVLAVIDAAITAPPAAEGRSDELAQGLEQARAVLEVGGQFRGINRKFQMKVTKMTPASQACELQLVLKWGGVLTPLGRSSAEQMGRSFRERLYPGVDGLLRLHATYRHDLKIFSSDEGRVQVSAAAFCKGLLDLEGHLTPILESLVTKNNALLHDTSRALKHSQQAKETLRAVLGGGTRGDMPAHIARALDELGSPEQAMRELHASISALCARLRTLVRGTKRGGRGSASATAPLREDSPAPTEDSVSASLGQLGLNVVEDRGDGAASVGELLRLCLFRWEKLERDFVSKRNSQFDISKIPDIYDCATYDVVHTSELLRLPSGELLRVYQQAKALARIVVPQEYGHSSLDKLRLGALTCSKLLLRIRDDLRLAASEPSAGPQAGLDFDLADELGMDSEADYDTAHRLDMRAASAMGVAPRHVRTRLFFTSESHVHAVLNVLRYAFLADGTLPRPSPVALEHDADELGYLAHIVFRLIECTDAQGQVRHKVRVSFSGGVNLTLTPEGEPALGHPDVVPPTDVKGRVGLARQLPPASPLVPLWGPEAELDLFDATRLLEFSPNRLIKPQEDEGGDWDHVFSKLGAGADMVKL